MNVTTALSRALWHYDIVSETLYQPELGEYSTYGVRVRAPGCADILHDISVCKKTAEHIVGCLNRYQVSPVHLHDVVMDLLP